MSTANAPLAVVPRGEDTAPTDDISSLILRLIRKEIRADPRTEELGQLKRDFDSLQTDLNNIRTALSTWTAETTGVQKRVAAIANEIDVHKTLIAEAKRPAAVAPSDFLKTISETEERLTKRSKTVDLSLKSFEGRLAVLEEKERIREQ